VAVGEAEANTMGGDSFRFPCHGSGVSDSEDDVVAMIEILLER